MFYVICKTLSAAPSVSFNQSVYSVSRGDRLVQLVLVLSNPSSVDTTVEVINADTGKQLILLHSLLHYEDNCTL